MVAENEVRADLSPWEKVRIVVESRDQRLFPTSTRLPLPALNCQKRNRIRATAEVVELLPDGLLSETEAERNQAARTTSLLH